jgi:hypothetical protein
MKDEGSEFLPSAFCLLPCLLAQAVGQEVVGAVQVLLGQAVEAVQVRVATVAQHLGQAGGQVQGVAGGQAIDRLLHPVAETVVYKCKGTTIADKPGLAVVDITCSIPFA